MRILLFPTIEFAIFFVVVLPLSWALMPRPHAWKPVMLFISYAFYAAADWRFCLLLGAITGANQVAARGIARVGGGESTAGRRICAAAVVADLALLGVFKYYGFFIDEINGSLSQVGLGLPLPLASLALPIGISFFTFQAISYVVDVKRGLLAPAPLLDVGLYLSFFPHLVAGPIVRAREFLPQLEQPRSATADMDAEYPSATVSGIATWRCDRLERRFTAVATAPDGRETLGRAETRTPDCRDRLEVVVPRRIARNAVLAVTVLDRFTLGGTRATVCAARRGAKEHCKRVELPEAEPRAVARFRAGGNAVWRVRVKHEAGTIRRVLTVGSAKRPADAAGLPSLLVAGDSLIQGVDAFLGDRLQTAFDVTSDTRPGTGLVKPGLDWRALARSHAAKLSPAVTVMSLGVNDGVPFGGAKCCGDTWSAAYGRRVRGLMRTYSRRSGSRVLWLTLPIPRDPRFAKSVRAVNVGIRQAAMGQDRVTLVEVDKLLTPDDQYRDAMAIGGRTVRVRAADGIHLSVAGARHVAGVVVATLRRFRATG